MLLRRLHSDLAVFLCIGLLVLSASCHSQVDDAGSQAVPRDFASEALKKIRALDREGVAYRNDSQYKEALKTHFEALEIAREINDTAGQIFALNNIGTDLRRTSSNFEASSYHYAALELCGDDRRNLKSRAVAMNGLGNIFISLNRPEEAIGYLKQSLEIEKELKSRRGQAINFANIADAFHLQGRIDSAQFYYLASLKENQAINSDIGIALCKKSLGKIYLEQGKTKAGLLLVEEAVRLVRDSKDAHHKVRIEIALCEALIENGRWEEAEPYLDDILSLAHAMSSYDYLHVAYGMLADLKENRGKRSEAAMARNRTIAYRDSMLSQNNEIRILELENRYKSERAAQQIRLLEAEKILAQKTRKEQARIFFLIIFVLGVLSAFLKYKDWSRRQLAKELEKVGEMKSRFFANISHEFRTPLTLIKAPVEHLIESVGDERKEVDLNIVLRNANHMLFLVEQILNISKIDSGKFTIRLQPGDLSQVIRTISDSFEFFASEKSLAYERDIEPSGHVWFDPNIVQILLVNLLSNAMKFSPEKGNVSLKARSLGDTYEFALENDTVRDFTEEELSQIFNRYYTTSKDAYKGTGIGLSLIKEICALYHAQIDFGYDDRRVKFIIRMPVDKSLFPKDMAVSTLPPSEPGPAVKEEEEGLGTEAKEVPIILIVEDNDDMRLFLENLLKGSYQVLTARDTAQGISMAFEAVPDIILSDVLMPGQSGLTLCRTLKADYRTSHIPIILLTALSDEEDIVKGLDSQADDYMVKPFNAKILQAKIRNQLNYRDVLVRKYREASKQALPEIETLAHENSFATLLDGLAESIMNPDFGVDAFCDACCMSRTQLHRKLKATTGLSATAYLRFRRVRIAAELLKDAEVSVADACFSSGFNDASYFSKCFKEEMNVSPTDYRKRFLS